MESRAGLIFANPHAAFFDNKQHSMWGQTNWLAFRLKIQVLGEVAHFQGITGFVVDANAISREFDG